MNSKNRKIILILITAILMSIMGGIAMYQYLNPEKTTVYVFNDNYTAGTVLKSEMLISVQCDSGIVVAGKSTETSARFVTGKDISDVLSTGDSLRMDVGEGMPLTLAMLSVTGGSSIEMSMDPSKVAVTIPVTNTSGVTKDLKEGSRVNIYATGLNSRSATTLIFQKMRVLSVTKDGTGALTAATIEVSPEESLKLIYAANTSSLYLGLVDSTGYQEIDMYDPTYDPTLAEAKTSESNDKDMGENSTEDNSGSEAQMEGTKVQGPVSDLPAKNQKTAKG